MHRIYYKSYNMQEIVRNALKMNSISTRNQKCKG